MNYSRNPNYQLQSKQRRKNKEQQTLSDPKSDDFFNQLNLSLQSKIISKKDSSKIKSNIKNQKQQEKKLLNKNSIYNRQNYQSLHTITENYSNQAWSTSIKIKKQSGFSNQINKNKKNDIYINNPQIVQENIFQSKFSASSKNSQSYFYQISGSLLSLKNQQIHHKLKNYTNNKQGSQKDQNHNYCNFRSNSDNHLNLNQNIHVNINNNNYGKIQTQSMPSISQISVHDLHDLNPGTTQSAILQQRSMISVTDYTPAEEPCLGAFQNGLRYQLPYYIQYILNFDQTFEKILKQQASIIEIKAPIEEKQN